MSQHDGMTEERSPLVRALLDAAARETVPAGSRERVARSLGLAAAGCSSPSVAFSEAPQASARRASWAKLALLAVVGGLCIGGSSSEPIEADRDTPRTVALALAPAPEAPPVQATLALPSAVQVSAPAITAPRSSEPPRMRRSVARPPAKRASAPAPASPEAGLASGLIEEVRQLDAVRARLREHRAAAALEQLDAYARAFPSGELALEAAVLKVQTLFEAGRPSEAQALARATLLRAGSERYESELRARLAEHGR